MPHTEGAALALQWVELRQLIASCSELSAEAKTMMITHGDETSAPLLLSHRFNIKHVCGCVTPDIVAQADNISVTELKQASRRI